MNGRRRNRGVALLVVLWATALLTIMLAAYAVTTRTEGMQARYQFYQAQARYAAEAGIARAVYGLREPDPDKRWIADGRPYTFNFDKAVVTVTMVDESGKVDLNTATPQILAGLFHAAGLDADRAEALSEAVQDWRDSDDATRPNGAERAQYRDAGRDYGPRNGPFASIEELQMVLGMDGDLYTKLAPAITVWSGRNTPDPGTAPALVLQALPGMSARQAGDYIQLRQQRGSAQDPAPPLSGPLSGIGGSGGGSTPDIHVVAKLSNGTHAALDVVLRLGGVATGDQPYEVLHWQQDSMGEPTEANAAGGSGTVKASAARGVSVAGNG